MNSSMDNLDMLPDDELRLRLIQYGFPNLPVTGTTRNLLIKKLRNYMNNEKLKLNRQTTSATRYSSGEESDSILNKSNKNRRKTTVTTTRQPIANVTPTQTSQNSVMPPPASTTRSRRSLTTSPITSTSINQINNKQIGSNYRLNDNPDTKKKSSIYVSHLISTSDTDEDSDYGVGSSNKINNNNNLKPRASPSTFLSRFTASSTYSPPIKSTTTSTTAQQGYISNNNFSRPTSFTNNYSNNRNTYLGTNLRNRNTVSAALTRNTSTSNEEDDDDDEDDNDDSENKKDDRKPYLSEYTIRLLKLRGDTVKETAATAAKKQKTILGNNNKEEYLGRNPIINRNITPTNRYWNDITLDSSANDLNISKVNRSSRYERMSYQLPMLNESNKSQQNIENVGIGRALNNLIKKFDEHYIVKQTFIPCILLTLLIAFLFILIFSYITISPDIVNTLNRRDTIFKLCNNNNLYSGNIGFILNDDFVYNDDDDIPTVTCIDDTTLDATLNLLKFIAHELQKRIENYYCGKMENININNNKQHIISFKDVLKLALNNDKELHVLPTINNIHNIEYLISINKQWRINNVDGNGNELDIKNVLKLRNEQTNYFTILKPKLPFKCLIVNKLNNFFIIIGTFAFFLITYIFIKFLYNHIKTKQLTRQNAINQLINDIINYCIENNKNLIVVNHLRDKLLLPSERKVKELIWTEAIKFLENNESRLQFEIGICNGEECKMIKWIDTTTPSIIQSAINTGAPITNLLNHSTGNNNIKQWQSPAFDKSNKVREPPSPCLKIRQMFDKYDTNNIKLKQIIQDSLLEKVGNECKIYDLNLDKNTCSVYVRCATTADAGIVYNNVNGWWFDKRLVSIKFLRLERYLQRFPKSLSGPQCLKPSNTKNLSMTQFYQQCAVNDYEDDDDDDDNESNNNINTTNTNNNNGDTEYMDYNDL